MNIQQVKKENEKYFAKGNKQFFNDISYKVRKRGKDSYLLTHTYGWTDMFGQPKTAFYTLKSISNDMKITGVSTTFSNMEDVNQFLKDI